MAVATSTLPIPSELAPNGPVTSRKARGGARPLKGFFDADHSTFGMPLRRSALEAAVQEVPGVRSVHLIRKRERGRLVFQAMNELIVEVAPDEVFRLENDPVHPERGTLRVLTLGGS